MVEIIRGRVETTTKMLELREDCYGLTFRDRDFNKKFPKKEISIKKKYFPLIFFGKRLFSTG